MCTYSPYTTCTRQYTSYVKRCHYSVSGTGNKEHTLSAAEGLSRSWVPGTPFPEVIALGSLEQFDWSVGSSSGRIELLRSTGLTPYVEQDSPTPILARHVLTRRRGLHSPPQSYPPHRANNGSESDVGHQPSVIVIKVTTTAARPLNLGSARPLDPTRVCYQVPSQCLLTNCCKVYSSCLL